MRLEDEIREAIELEADKLIQRYHDYHNSLHLEYTRKRDRVTDALPKVVKRPESWSAGDRHNPFYVRRRAASIAKSIAKKIRDRSYHPNPPFIREIQKPGGGTRKISVFEIPDAAVSRLYYSGLLAKNKHRFSSFSYAYRNDRNVHFAIQDIAVDLQDASRTFVAEFDFSDFFGSIAHNYLIAQLDKNGFLVGADDRHVIAAFLKQQGEKGIPQGTSISLFLANLVCWELDKKLERCGVKFARYADDTVIWTQEYEKICDAFTCIDDFSREAGVKLNAAKSAGISLLKKRGMPAEMAAKDTISFLGYSLSVDAVSIKDQSIAKIKANISYILVKHLIQPLRTTPLKALKIPANDQDPALSSAISEIRRYLYGGLTSTQILNYIHGKTKRIYFKGIMSYYPLISDESQLKRLDGWLISAVFRAIQARQKLLVKHGFSRVSSSFPFNVARSNLVAECRARRIGGRRAYEIPSLSLIHGALTHALTESGIEKIMNSRSLAYVY